jgi:hypothetical protein
VVKEEVTMNTKMQEVIEGTEVTETGMVCLTGEAIEAYRLRLLISSYAMEIAHGIRTVRYPLSRVAAQYGVTVRSKKGAMKQLMAIYEETYGEPMEMSPAMEKALAK